MRILVVTNLFPPHSYGGYEDMCQGAVRHWHAAGHEVTVLTSDRRRPDVARLDDEPGVHRLLPLYWADHVHLDPGLFTSSLWDRRALRTVAAIIDRSRPDVVSVWNPAGLPFSLFNVLATRNSRVQLVIGDRWLEWGSDRGDAWRARFTARGTASRHLASILAGNSVHVEALGGTVTACFASEHLREHARHHSDWRLDSTALVPHGVDLDTFPIDRPRVRPWSGRLIFVGRVVPEKGLTTVVRALAQLPGSTLDVHGLGSSDFEHAVRQLGDREGVTTRISWHGETRAGALRSAYAAADALVFPSLWQEPFGIVPLEAMASGIPVIATATGGSGEFLVHDTTAITFDRDDADGLVRAVKRVAGDEGLRQRLASNGNDVARWLDRRITYDALLAGLEALLDDQVAPPPDRPLLPPELTRR